MASFSRKLDELKNNCIVVVMSDGMAFKGTLVDFDDDMIVMRDIAETNTQEIEWQNQGKKEKKGYIPWRDIALKEVIIRMDKVLRIWPWYIEEKKSEVKNEKEEEFPIYSMGLVSFGG